MRALEDVQYIKGYSVHRGDTISTSGGYHEYIGGCSVHQGMFSTSERYHDACDSVDLSQLASFASAIIWKNSTRPL